MEEVNSQKDFDVSADGSGAKLQGQEGMDIETVKKRSLIGVVSFFSRTILLTGVTLVAQLLLAAKLSPEDFGIYGIVVTITNFFTIISDIGLAASLIQKKTAPTVTELRTTFTVQQTLSWFIFVLIAATSSLLHSYGKLDTQGVYLALAFGLSFPIVSLKTISSILLERELAFGKLVIPAIIETIVFNIIAVTLAFNGYGVMSFTIAVLVKAIVGVLVMFCIKRWEMGIALSLSSLKELLKVGGAFQLNDMLAKAKDDVFYITVAILIPAREYGYVTWAKQWSRLPYSLTVDNVTALTFPAFSRLQHDKNLLRRAIEKSLFFITLLAFPLFAGISVMIFPILVLVPEYEKWRPAILSLILFCISLAFAAFSTPLINTLNAIGKISESLRMMIFWTISQWMLFPFFFRWFGYESVAIIGVVLALTSLFVVLLVKKYVEFSFLENIWRQVFATLVMAVTLFSTQAIWQISFMHFFIGVLVGVCVYTAMILLLGYSTVKREVFSLLKKQ